MKFNKIEEKAVETKVEETVVQEDGDEGMEDGMAEVELVLAEPTKMVDADGSIVLAEPGDIVHVQSESIKRIIS